MIRKSFLLLGVIYALVVLMIMLISRSFWLDDIKSNTLQSQQALLEQISKLKLSLAQPSQSIDTRQGLSSVLQFLNSDPQILHWQLKDPKGNLIVSKSVAVNTNLTNEQTLAFVTYVPIAKQEYLTLIINYKSQASNNTPLMQKYEFFIWLLLVGSLLLLIFAKFSWLLKLEKFSESILVGQSIEQLSLPKSDAKKPIFSALAKLIHQNQLLSHDKKALTEQIRTTNYVDEVTELGNKAFFKAEFQVRLFHHQSPEQGLLFLFSFVEKDEHSNFSFEQTIARQVANILRSFSEKFTDSVVARLSHTDFVLLTPNQLQQDVDLLCKKIVTQLKKTVFDKTQIADEFVDIGISAYKQGFDYYKVIAEADMALRNAQLQGGNSWYMYGEALSLNKVKGFYKWQSFLQSVLDKRTIQLYGQKIIYINKTDFTHQEVLARINDNDELLNAETFLPMANRCGLASHFDRQIISRLIKHCLSNSQLEQPQKYSINLFYTSLLDDKFVGWLIGKLSSFPELSQNLIFEIKESQLFKFAAELQNVMQQVATLGVEWCADRIGEPESTLDFIEQLPISMVKIDRRLINQIAHNKQKQLLLNTLLINLSSMKLTIIAEGVENQADADYLKTTSINAMQGFYLGEPTEIES